MITTHDECHKGKAVKNYCIKMSVHCLLSTQTIRVQNHPDFNGESEGQLLAGQGILASLNLVISKPSHVQGGLAVSWREASPFGITSSLLENRDPHVPSSL